MKWNMGSTVQQSTKITQWTVSEQSNRSPSQKVSNQPTCKKVSQNSHVITQLVNKWSASLSNSQSRQLSYNSAGQQVIS